MNNSACSKYGTCTYFSNCAWQFLSGVSQLYSHLTVMLVFFIIFTPERTGSEGSAVHTLRCTEQPLLPAGAGKRTREGPAALLAGGWAAPQSLRVNSRRRPMVPREKAGRRRARQCALCSARRNGGGASAGAGQLTWAPARASLWGRV